MSRIKEIKKIELHRHIEGCITPELLQTLIQKYDHKTINIQEVGKLFVYNDFSDFLKSFGTVVTYLRSYEDFKLLAKEVILQLRNENVVYAELIFSPQSYIIAGLDLETILLALHEEFSVSNIKTHLILDIVRHWGLEKAEDYVNEILKVCKKNQLLRNWVVAISLGGDEIAGPAKMYTKLFEKIRTNGIKAYAHAGEWDGSQSVWDAIKLLNVSRIGHGVQSIQDENLLSYLKSNNIMLDVSITSNYQTGIFGSDDLHPVVEFIKQGIKVSLNTDDPSFFHTDLNSEYIKAHQMGISFEQLSELPRNALDSTMMSETDKNQIFSLLN